ncbi:MAG: hypothetical protein IH963_08855 [Chloroflexi bacterium]|nr:hypothetical protein [Chloroflexota bacterium]
MAWESEQISPKDEEQLSPRGDETTTALTWPEGMGPDDRRDVLQKVRMAFRKWKELDSENVIGDDYIVFSLEKSDEESIIHSFSVWNLSMMFAPVIRRIERSRIDPNAFTPDLRELNIPVRLENFIQHSRQFGLALEEQILADGSFFSVLVDLQSES